MSYILNIETSTTVCSVALSENEKPIVHVELNDGFTHAENLHLFIEKVLKEAQVKPQQLAAIGVSRGPGSYTGLRIGVSTAKGLAYALNIPLISVDTLQVMANAASKQVKEQVWFCPMIDARRMEVYTALYDEHLVQLQATEALIVDETSVEKFKSNHAIYFFGDGMPKCMSLLSEFKNGLFLDNIHPSAEHMASLVYKKLHEKNFEDTAYFEPFYLKDFMILKKKSKV